MDDSFIAALDEAAKEAVALFRDALGVTTTLNPSRLAAAQHLVSTAATYHATVDAARVGQPVVSPQPAP